ncbi:MAG: ribonuclease III [Anaplasmataceae bacterium]|nr:ribonuclease III [Anaplasmataceae bacterium]
MKKVSKEQPKNISQLESKINIGFINKNLLWESLTHRSYLNENHSWDYPHNERLEFLGDAVLELAISVLLYRKFPKAPEGEMTMLRAALVNYQRLALVAKEINLNKFILMSKGEARDSGRAHDVILANAIEALIGAIYLDQGFKIAHSFIESVVFTHLEDVLVTKSYKDPKSELQEIVQEKLKLTPNYKVRKESGPAHEKTFTVGVYFGEKMIAEGDGKSKQEAETDAARKALQAYQNLKS